MEPVGFEPTTFRLQGECSPNWAMSPWFLFSLIQLPIICSQHMITSSSTRLSGNRTKETDKVNYYGNNLFIHYKAHFLETSSVFYNFFSNCRKRFGRLRTHILQLLWRSILLSYKSLGCYHMRPTYDWFLLLQIAKLFATRTPPTGADPAISTVTGWRLCCLSSETHWLFTYTIRLTFWKPRQLFVTFLMILYIAIHDHQSAE